jgi:phenylacetate-CoA ligase
LKSYKDKEGLMFWDEKMEKLPRDEMVSFQEDHLKKMVSYAYENVDFYRQTFNDIGVHPGHINRIEDISRLPFTTKSDLRSHYPYGFCAVPPTDLVRMHASSGTTGKPTPVFHTKKDLEKWIHCMARNCYTAGIRQDDICQIAFKYTLFTGAFGHHMGVERIGAMIIPTSSGQTERQITMMCDFNTTVIHCTPSYAITIAEKMTEMGIGRNSLSLRLGIHGAEPMSEQLREGIEEKFGTIAIGDYGLTELGGPGVSIECPEKNGYHINEDYFYPEIIDPETLKQRPDGETGELVLTTLQKEAVPLIRYRTRDITSLEREKCGCGRTLVRHRSVLGRTDDMLIIRGVNFFPSQLESILLDSHEVSPHYSIHLTKEKMLDHVLVEIEPTPAYWASAADATKSELKRKIENRVKDLIGLKIKIRLVAPYTIPRSEGKAQRIVDDRQA